MEDKTDAWWDWVETDALWDRTETDALRERFNRPKIFGKVIGGRDKKNYQLRN